MLSPQSATESEQGAGGGGGGKESRSPYHYGIGGMDDSGYVNDECGICLGEWTDPVTLPCGHTFCADCLSGWKPKFSRPKDRQRKRCPLCRATIPPSQEQIAALKTAKSLMKNTSHPRYDEHAREVEQFKAEYGEDWDGTMIEYDSDFVDLPKYVVKALGKGNLRTVLQWLDVNILEVGGASVLTASCIYEGNLSETVGLLLSWGAEHIVKGERETKEGKLAWRQEISAKGNVELANLMSSELGGRRCEIVSPPNPNTRDNLVGKTCVVEEYIEISDQYKVRMEFTNEVLLLDPNMLKRRDRTPQDPGYYVECKNNRLIRRDFKSNEECRAFIASLGSDVGELSKVDPDAGAKAEQAAADLLAELGLEDLDGPSSSASKKNNQPASSGGKKKKRGGKKKGRNHYHVSRHLNSYLVGCDHRWGEGRFASDRQDAPVATQAGVAPPTPPGPARNGSLRGFGVAGGGTRPVPLRHFRRADSDSPSTGRTASSVHKRRPDPHAVPPRSPGPGRGTAVILRRLSPRGGRSGGEGDTVLPRSLGARRELWSTPPIDARRISRPPPRAQLARDWHGRTSSRGRRRPPVTSSDPRASGRELWLTLRRRFDVQCISRPPFPLPPSPGEAATARLAPHGKWQLLLPLFWKREFDSPPKWQQKLPLLRKNASIVTPRMEYKEYPAGRIKHRTSRSTHKLPWAHTVSSDSLNLLHNGTPRGRHAA
ncbi:hypothetical protein THAOC_13597, partial [Thalassiosira oceanica]